MTSQMPTFFNRLFNVAPSGGPAGRRIAPACRLAIVREPPPAAFYPFVAAPAISAVPTACPSFVRSLSAPDADSRLHALPNQINFPAPVARGFRFPHVNLSETRLQ